MIRLEAGDADGTLRAADRRARAQLPALAAAAAAGPAGEGAVAGAGGRPGRAGRDRLRRPLPGLGPPEDRDADARRRPPRARLDRLRALEAHRPGAARSTTRPSAGSTPRRRRAAFVVPPSRPEPGLAARLQRVRDPAGRHLADRRRRRLLVEARARLARLDHAEPPRRDRDGRAGDHRERTAASADRCSSCSPTARPARSGRSRSSPTTGPASSPVRFAAFIERHPELIHIRTRRKSPARTASASAPSAR